VQRAQVRLRGWYYPHISNRDSERTLGENYIAYWSTFQDHVEYWRFYQSTQFIHLFVIEEAVNEMWDQQLRSHAVSELFESLSREDIPAFFSIDNFIYTVTEIFEFAARLASAGLYSNGINISIRLNRIANFALSDSNDRVMNHLYKATEPSLSKSWEYRQDELVSSVPDVTLNAVVWFFERFGWFRPPRDSFKTSIENYLAGRR